ncbi:dethiobiotin synthase [Thaumasiovibrio subtropicus]|uniref:dethiobiotin synthase n=1 Tax=Thaumasiovibrio subtropicus TaxID=1891207 RepID=UPI000B34E5DB|nr:dethiobiotin synthase [Thaumasiovibrio subtropicus]
MSNAFFVAGTDTEVGKTVCSRAIIQSAVAAGVQVAGFKPVASGSQITPVGTRNTDALYLQDASNVELTYEEVNPYTLVEASSPHLSARKEDIAIEFDVIDSAFAHLKSKSEMVLVEGAGGWRVPVTDEIYLSDWVQRQKLPVILVVGVKLGCMSHAVLTAEAIERDGLEVVGWVANRINPGLDNYADVIKWLEDKLPGQKLGEIPYMPGITKRDLSSYIDFSLLASNDTSK